MKIYLNKPKNSWISPYEIVEKIIFWREIDYDEPLVKNIIKYTQLGWFCSTLFDIRRVFERDIRYIKIDPWDTWSMDSTLTPIILPMLKQLKKDKHGAPHVDNEDVPPALRNKKVLKLYDTDKYYFERWEWVMDQMIWSFTELSKEDWAAPFWSGKVDEKWIKLPNGNYEIKKGARHTLKFDKKAHDRHWAQIQNGLRLFGKYYTSLWD
jgi:hypothetical protein